MSLVCTFPLALTRCLDIRRDWHEVQIIIVRKFTQHYNYASFIKTSVISILRRWTRFFLSSSVSISPCDMIFVRLGTLRSSS